MRSEGDKGEGETREQRGRELGELGKKKQPSTTYQLPSVTNY
ncbi:hypothetical protein [Scytonema millei]|nr:hypothetical protein [Scytonema millei]